MRNPCAAAIVAFLAAASPLPATAGSCDGGHTIDSVSSYGTVLVLEDESVWRIDQADQADVAAWSEGDDITVCDGVLVNTDDNETADADPVGGSSDGQRPHPRLKPEDLARARAVLAERQAVEEARRRQAQLYDPSQYRFDPNTPVIALPLQTDGRSPR